LLRDNRLDLFTADGAKRSLELMDEWFQAHRSVPVSVESIFRAVEERKQEFTWLSHAEHSWYVAAESNPQLANNIAAYFAQTSGRPGSFIKDGDPLFENMLEFFKELSSRREEVSVQSIAHAENRIANRPGPKLHYVPQPRRTEPISPAAKADDGKPFIMDGLKKQRDGSYGKSPADYAAEARAAQEAANPQPTAQERLSVEDARWRSMAEQACNFGSHGQQQTLKQEFDKAQASGLDWRRTYEAVNQVVNMYRRSAQVRGWAGR
jgi:hypothetical protein